MKNWTELCSDVNWEDYHGMWARKARDGSWYVLRWTNLWDAAGESEDLPQYECEVRRVDLNELPCKEVKSALDCCGLRIVTTKIDEYKWVSQIESDQGDVVANSTEPGDRWELVLVEMCIQYGLGAPLESFTGDKWPKRIRAQARRTAEECMRQPALLEDMLDRPVNAIGSTAREYGRGDIDSAMHRGRGIQFATLQVDGTLTDVRYIQQSNVKKCPFSILVPEHYRDDQTCKCDDASHREIMIREWEYTPEDFTNIPLRQA